jgi:5-methylcytosine-specific restriction endonuclease McrA
MISDIEKFSAWLKKMGVEILPVTNQYEALRFKGKEVGVVYTSGKVSNDYTRNAINCFTKNKHWDGRQINTGRHAGYKKEKEQLIERDGTDCFLCGLPLQDDITLEHLIPLSSGGKNNLSNMVLMHEKCNQEVSNIPISQKVNTAIKNRIIIQTANL